MSSTYTDILRFVIPTVGELDGTWGTTLSAGFTQLAETAIAGTAVITHDDTANYTLTTASGAADEARSMFLNITGALGAARNVVCPTKSKLYFIKNGTTGGFAVTFKTTAGTGISVPNGKYMMLYCDGTNVVEAISQTAANTSGNATTATTATGANALYSATTTVNVSSATAPSANQVLTASSSTAATWATPTATPTAANPTGTIAGSAVNGSAATFMRSDAAPALSLTLAQLNTAVSDADVASLAGTETLTNKRVTARVSSATSYTTDTGTSLNCDTLDEFIVTAQAGALKFNNPTGTPTEGQSLFIAVTGTAARALTYDTQFEASAIALPTTTVTTARLNMKFLWRADTSKWHLVLATVASAAFNPAAPGAIGGTTPAAGAFTTLSSSSDATLHSVVVGLGASSVATNTAVGVGALGANTTGQRNTAIGHNAMAATTEGSYSVAVGQDALVARTTGASNVALGSACLSGVTTGANNIGIGLNAGSNLTTGGSTIYIGTSVSASAVGAASEIVLSIQSAAGKGNSTGFFDAGGGNYAGNNSVSWSTTSDRRIKKNIVDLPESLPKILALRPREFDYRVLKNPDGSVKHDASFIAQEFSEVFPEQVNQHVASPEEAALPDIAEGELIYGIDHNLVPYLVKALQELNAKFEAYVAAHP